MRKFYFIFGRQIEQWSVSRITNKLTKNTPFFSVQASTFSSQLKALSGSTGRQAGRYEGFYYFEFVTVLLYFLHVRSSQQDERTSICRARHKIRESQTSSVSAAKLSKAKQTLEFCTSFLALFDASRNHSNRTLRSRLEVVCSTQARMHQIAPSIKQQ
jgi:hypothetical protein